ncbi:two-component system, chemotaxis family [Terrimicrobium sacchariphilum]|jgi:two-component system CheB/CheR fusion protein|uniref:Two-component system, chemotaxis family n=1 Tax=Terrimicrobium sacchariphilum TaxID=690879 RepID=A0A146GBK1_TERSA|nr:response regulator [Terrimicrobium sacchariphilum]GAT33906.1 two-component system, chemotaxis family [Terrimicrobium sacchariphilum]
MEDRGRALSIFIVENHEDTLQYLGKYLSMVGHSVRSARDMASALEDLRSVPVDVLISDIGLPDGDGWELMRRIRESGVLPFGIAMSGYGMRADKEKSLSAGFRHHLVKPFGPDELDTVLKEAAAEISAQ